MHSITALTFDGNDDLYINDPGNSAVLEVTPAATAPTVVAAYGTGKAYGDGNPALGAYITGATGITMNPAYGHLT